MPDLRLIDDDEETTACPGDDEFECYLGIPIKRSNGQVYMGTCRMCTGIGYISLHIN